MEAGTGVGVVREERSHGNYIIRHPRLGDHGEREGRWAVGDRDRKTVSSGRDRPDGCTCELMAAGCPHSIKSAL